MTAVPQPAAALQCRAVPNPSLRSRFVVLALLVGLLAAACGGGGDDDESATTDTAASDRLTIWAPNDLQKPLDSAVASYRKRQPDVTVDVLYGNARELNDRLLVGERPDLYLGTAVEVQTLGDEGTLPEERVDFGEDTVVMIVTPGNPKQITELSVFGADPTTTSSLCPPQAGCGRGGRAVLANARITALPDSIEPDPATMLERVSAGSVDTGLLYRTQAVRARIKERISYVAIPTTAQVNIPYQFAVVRSGGAVDGFVQFLEEWPGIDRILARSGLAPLEGDPQPST